MRLLVHCDGMFEQANGSRQVNLKLVSVKWIAHYCLFVLYMYIVSQKAKINIIHFTYSNSIGKTFSDFINRNFQKGLKFNNFNTKPKQYFHFWYRIFLGNVLSTNISSFGLHKTFKTTIVSYWSLKQYLVPRLIVYAIQHGYIILYKRFIIVILIFLFFMFPVEYVEEWTEWTEMIVKRS